MFLLLLMYAPRPYQWATQLNLEPAPYVPPKRQTHLLTLFG